jgi:hypothetical protein
MRSSPKSLTLLAITIIGAGFIGYQGYVAMAQFIGPGNCTAGNCSGAIAVDSKNDVGFGAAATTTARFYSYGSTTAGTYAILASGTIYSSTGGFKFPDGTSQTTAFSGSSTTLAVNVSAGAFGANTGGGNYSFPANVGVGTTTPSAKLTIANNVASGFLDNYSEYQILLYDGGTASNSYGLGVKASTMVLSSAGGYSFDRTGNATSMAIDSSGNVAVNGNIASGSGTATTTSITIYDPWNGVRKGLFSAIDSRAGGGVYPGSLQLDWGGLRPIYYSPTGGTNSIELNDLDTTAGVGIVIRSFVPAATTYPAVNIDTYNTLTDTNGVIAAFRNGGTLKASITKDGGATFGSTVTVGGGTGKINVGTVDPIYTIGGVKYATYLPGMTGQKEETADTTQCYLNQGTCRTVIDFTALAKGSDLWLFGKATNIVNNFDALSVQLTPSFEGTVWYTKDATKKRLTIFGKSQKVSGQQEVSYRLTAPRFDAASWTNSSHATDEGFNLDTLGIN